ncbi:hypothetical protein JD844_015098 [Phrynosoma platyrhinos]|uniref:Fibrosin like 1 n=1 Tax=Phrynosoma platyrhinos TaxID=52577 RepID=A0ABQ7T735_PHRPL|nr:hypothetical protein JD844_015098 [Phrynosoma platyrhinos]
MRPSLENRKSFCIFRCQAYRLPLTSLAGKPFGIRLRAGLKRFNPAVFDPTLEPKIKCLHETSNLITEPASWVENPVSVLPWTAAKSCLGPSSNDKAEAKAGGIPKVSGLERSQELNTDVPFVLPLHSPPATTTIVTSNSSAPTSSAWASPLLKKEPLISAPAPPRLTPQPQSQLQLQPQPRPQSQPQLLPELRTQPPSHILPSLSYQVHHQVAHNGLNNIRSQSQHQHHPAMFATPPTLPPPPAIPTNSLVIPGHPAGRQSLTALAHSVHITAPACVPAPTHRSQYEMETSSACLPSCIPVTVSLRASELIEGGRGCDADKSDTKIQLYQPVDIIQPTNHVLPASFGDSDWYFVTGISLTSTNESSRRKPPQHDLQKQGMPDYELLRRELKNRFVGFFGSEFRQSSCLSWPVPLLRVEFDWQHATSNTRSLLFHPACPRCHSVHFDKYGPKLDNPYFRHSNYFPSYPPAMPGMPPMLPHSGPFGSLQGAFQPKTSNPIDVASRPGAVHHTLLQKTPGVSDPYRAPVRKPGKWCAVHVQIAWQIYHHQQKIKQMQLDPHKLEIGGKLDLFSRPPAPSVFPGFHYPQDLARPLFSTTGSTHPPTTPFGPSPHHSSFLPTSHLADPFSRSSTFSGLGNLGSNAFGGLGSHTLNLMDKNRHSTRSSPASAPVTHQISNLIRSNSQTSSDPTRQAGLSDRERSKESEREREIPDRLRDPPPVVEHKIKESRSPVKEPPSHEKRSTEDNTKPVIQSVSPYSKPALSETLKLSNLMNKDIERKPELPTDLQKIKNDIKVKEECKEDGDVLVVSSEPSQHSRTVEHPPPPSLHGLPLPHTMAATMPISMSSVHQMSNMNVLDRSRMMTPLMGMNSLSGRERLPHPGFSWDAVRDPLRDAYRSLDLHRRMDFQLRTDPIHRFPTTSGFYDHERPYRDREPHDYNHENLLEARREQERLRQAEERERLHLREELERARMHHLHSSPIESHLAHVPSFMPHLSGMHYPRLSPSAAMHNGILNRNPPTAALSAPPPLVPASTTRPSSPRRTTPLTTESRDYSPSRNPKEVEAR